MIHIEINRIDFKAIKGDYWHEQEPNKSGNYPVGTYLHEVPLWSTLIIKKDRTKENLMNLDIYAGNGAVNVGNNNIEGLSINNLSYSDLVQLHNETGTLISMAKEKHKITKALKPQIGMWEYWSTWVKYRTKFIKD